MKVLISGNLDLASYVEMLCYNCGSQLNTLMNYAVLLCYIMLHIQMCLLCGIWPFVLAWYHLCVARCILQHLKGNTKKPFWLIECDAWLLVCTKLAGVSSNVSEYTGSHPRKWVSSQSCLANGTVERWLFSHVGPTHNYDKLWKQGELFLQ